MARVEVQYAVRVPDGWGGWKIVRGERYEARLSAEYAAIEYAYVSGRPRAEVEVVAQAVMVAGDWGTPDDVEQMVRDLNDHERRCEQMAMKPLSDGALRELGLYECASCGTPIVRGERCGACGRGWLVKQADHG